MLESFHQLNAKPIMLTHNTSTGVNNKVCVDKHNYSQLCSSSQSDSVRHTQKMDSTPVVFTLLC